MPRHDHRWPDGAKLALSIVVTSEKGSEYKVAEGNTITEPAGELSVSLSEPLRNCGNESNYRYGSNEGRARIASLLDQHSVSDRDTLLQEGVRGSRIKFLRYANQKPHVWLTTRRSIAEHFAQTVAMP